MSAKDKIWRYLIEHNNQATNAELAFWLRGQPGQLSIGQRLREIRQSMLRKGGDLLCAEVKLGVYKYTIVWPEPKRTQNEEAVAENYQKTENRINMAAV